MVRKALAALAFLLVACGSQPFKPDIPAPSDERVMELARQRPTVEEKDRDPISLEVQPMRGRGPLKVTVWLQLKPDVANVEYCLHFLNADGSRAKGSCRPLEANTWTLEFENVMPGTYTVVFSVGRNDGKPPLRVTSQPVCYVGPFTECSEDGGASK